ncbi:MAG TPA: aldo/keto reductase [Anaerolineae bacterium]|nr:aldo/keto reductase [Anaerolineae bacterium]
MTTTIEFQRTLGRSDIQVSPMSLGCWAIGGPWKWLDGAGGWGEVDDNESIRAIHAALDLGINFFDTAATYGTGHSEEVLAKALEGKRDKVVLATKFGFNVNVAEKHVTMRTDDHLQYIRQECEDSLRRLNTDVIDLYQLHVWDYPVNKVPAMLDVLESLVKDGKIRYYGWSTDSAESAKVFAKGEHCVAVQHDLNVILDAPEMLKLCNDLNLASINRSPLARGALSGKYSKDVVFTKNDVRDDDWSKEHFFTPTLSQLEKIRDVLTSDGRTLVQGALAWIWARSEKTIPIPGFRTVAQVEENAKAMELGPLSENQIKEIDSLLER